MLCDSRVEPIIYTVIRENANLGNMQSPEIEFRHFLIPQQHNQHLAKLNCKAQNAILIISSSTLILIIRL